MIINLCSRNCYDCIFGFCDGCDGNGADIEEKEVWDTFRSMALIFGHSNPPTLFKPCACSVNGHPFRNEPDDPETSSGQPATISVVSDLV